MKKPSHSGKDEVSDPACHNPQAETPHCHEAAASDAPTCHEHEGSGADHPSGSGAYICPMCPGVSSDIPAACPMCGMALEPANPATSTVYICTMHLEITKDAPGDCPICGMGLEPMTVVAEEGPNPELIDMNRRFWVSLLFTVPLLVLAMGEMVHLLPDTGLFGLAPYGSV